MKKSGVLNSRISHAIARMGHTQTLVICDAGLPCPLGVELIDVSVTTGIPGFLQVLDAVLGEFEVEAYTIANELLEQPDRVLTSLRSRLGGVEERRASHVDFKVATASAIAIIRTGECTPYANVILQSGVSWDA